MNYKDFLSNASNYGRNNRGQGIRVNQSIHTQNEIGHQKNRSSQERLEDRVEELSLACEAMWRILSQTLELTDEQLLEVISDIDASDGVKDGKYTPKAETCKCGAVINPSSKICIYCERKATKTKVF